MEEIKKEFKEMIKKGKRAYNIIYLEDTYTLLHKNDKFYYIQINEYSYDIPKPYYIVLYNKINPYKKRQADYSKGVEDLQDILNYIAITKNKKYCSIGPEQTIFWELDTIKNGKTILKHLKNIAGYREKYILNNLDRIEKEQETKGYYILKFIDKEENYFKINTKNIDRLIIG